MDELQPNARALLDAAHEGANPTDDEVTALAATLGLSPPPPPPSPAANQAPRQWKRWLLGLGGAAAAVAVIVVATSPTPSVREPVGLVTPDTSEPELELESEPAIQPTPAPVPEPGVRPEPVLETSETTAPPTPRAPRARTRRPRRESTEHGSADLRDELALIVRARKALAGGHNAEARSVARRYAKQYPRGSFVEEARVLQLVATCHLGRTATTTREAERYVAERSSSFARRVEDACLDPR